MSTKHHWENIFSNKTSDQMSWTQSSAARSLELINLSGISPDSSIVDIGSGMSVLVGQLFDAGFNDITVLDISSAAISKAKEMLGQRGAKAKWLVSNILEAQFEKSSFDLWHDRAVFHFLTKKEQRTNYIDKLKTALKPAAHVVLSTFSLSGPEKCSGLEVCRYSPESLQSELGSDFKLVKSLTETHNTPAGKPQNFVYCLFKKNN